VVIRIRKYKFLKRTTLLNRTHQAFWSSAPLLLLLLHPLIHSHKMRWISSTPPTAPPYCLPSQSNLQPNSFNIAALVDLQVKYSSIFSTCPSCLSNLKACCGKSSSLQGPLFLVVSLEPSMSPVCWVFRFRFQFR